MYSQLDKIQSSTRQNKGDPEQRTANHRPERYHICLLEQYTFPRKQTVMK